MPYDVSARGGFLKRRRTPKQVLDEIAEKGIAFIDLHLTDVPGRLRHVTIPAEMGEIAEETTAIRIIMVSPGNSNLNLRTLTCRRFIQILRASRSCFR